MQFYTCAVALAGDLTQIVVRAEDRPVTHPELLILAHIHGRDALRDIKPLHEAEVEDADERDRLNRLYGENVVSQLFPGTHNPLPTHNPRAKRGAAA